MALLEINLKKPALIEEQKHRSDGSSTSSSLMSSISSKSSKPSSKQSSKSSSKSSNSGSSGRSTGKSLLGLLLLAVVGAAAAKAMRSRSGRSDPMSYKEEDEPNPIIGAEETRKSSGWRRRVGGLLGTIAVLALVARTVRGRSN